jgi:hypothetical protein
VIQPIVARLQDGQVWLRVADERWDEPLDPSYAQRHGGRWNPPGSFPVLYLNENLETARAQIRLLLEGQPVHPEDLDPPFVLVASTLPSGQRVADAVTEPGLGSLGLPNSYPVDEEGFRISRSMCQPIGSDIAAAGLRGVHARSAATRDGSGRELAWFPARTSSRARPVGEPLPFDRWWSGDETPE